MKQKCRFFGHFELVGTQYQKDNKKLSTNVWELSNTFLNGLHVPKEITMEIRKVLKMNNNGNIIYKN